MKTPNFKTWYDSGKKKLGWLAGVVVTVGATSYPYIPVEYKVPASVVIEFIKPIIEAKKDEKTITD